MSAAFARGYGVPRGSQVSCQKTDSSKRRTHNTEHRMSNAEFSRQLLTGKVTIKNPVVFGGGIGNSPGMM
jgi:hypothetical protein